MKNLFMCLAAVGLFVACQPEELSTTFQPGPAQVTVKASAVDVNSQNPVSATFTSSYSGAEFDANGVLTIVENSAIKEFTLTVTAAYNSKSYPVDVVIRDLGRGGVAEYSVVIPVGVSVADAEIEVKDELVGTKDAVYYFSPEDHGHGHGLVDHDGKSWAKNLSEFILTGTVTYSNISGQAVAEDGVEYVDEGFKNVVEPYIAVYNSGVVAPEASFEFKVSAWAYYTVYQTVTTESHRVSITADGVEVGVIEYDRLSNAVEYAEIANPEGHGHYEHGHGVHGGGSNAGGGIVIPE